jgi:hypothetical protein
MAVNPHRRLASETFSLRLDVGKGFHLLDVSLAYDENTHLLREIAFVGRGKIGHGMDDMLRDLGVKLSRAIQSRDPETGGRLR